MNLVGIVYTAHKYKDEAALLYPVTWIDFNFYEFNFDTKKWSALF